MISKKIIQLIIFFSIGSFVIHGQNRSRTILITNATIVDGCGSERVTGSVRVSGDKIIGVGELFPSSSDTIINAEGLVLSPGFIDTHSHHGGGKDRTKEAAVSQGITTIIIGQDGSSSLPLKREFRKIRRSPWSVNVGSYSGHNSIRQKVMGNDFKRFATQQEIDKMKAILEEDMLNGALGLSTGLEYDPGIYSNSIEVIELAKIAANHGGRYISHIRSEDRNLVESIDEIIQIGKEANIPVQISHFKLAIKRQWGKAYMLLDKLDKARASGINITADVYPYLRWQSTMKVLFPERDFEDREAATFALTELSSPEGMLITRFRAKPEYENLTLKEIADLRNEDPVTTYMELIKLSEKVKGERIISKSMDEEDVVNIMNWAHTNICSDGSETGHPRGWGAFPRYLTMDTGQSLEEKINKMTAQAAMNLDLDGIGMIDEGFYADLVLFDPNTVKDKATFENSTLRSEGIKMVMVSGQIVYKDQKTTSVYSGRVLSRTQK